MFVNPHIQFLGQKNFKLILENLDWNSLLFLYKVHIVCCLSELSFGDLVSLENKILKQFFLLISEICSLKEQQFITFSSVIVKILSLCSGAYVDNCLVTSVELVRTSLKLKSA